MRTVNWGEKLPSQASGRVRLKSAGDKIIFRLLGKPVLEGSHFFSKDGKWDIKPCLRINKDQHCEYCEKFFAAVKEMPHIDDQQKYKKEIEELKKRMPGFEASISYNFPVINRETQEMVIFQTTPGLRNKIDSEAAILEEKIFNYDFVAKNTGKALKEKYALSRVDSADTTELTEKEIKIKENFDAKDFESKISGQSDDSSELAEQANTEIIDEEAPKF